MASVVRGEDEALLAEIAVHRKLVKLRLRAVAPTVLASALPLDETLTALREAGYFPIPVGPDGVPAIARMAPASSETPAIPVQAVTSSQRGDVSTGTGVSPDELAGRLMSAPNYRRVTAYEVEAVISQGTPLLTRGDRFNLQYLVVYGMPATVEATDDDGTITRWDMEHGELDGETLDAWCPDLGDYQRVPLSNIARVRR